MRDLKYRFVFQCLLFSIFLFFSKPAKAQKTELLLDVITTLETKTDFNFLYRESLVSNIRVSINTDDDNIFDDLQGQLNPYGIEIEVDSSRQQVLFLETSDLSTRKTSIELSGYVVDAHTGERLPYSTVTWKEAGLTKGIAANSVGSFNITSNNYKPNLKIQASFIGYETEEILLDLTRNQKINGITIRLASEVISGGDILVTGTPFYANLDSSLSGLVNTGKFSPLGETNAVRALQALPSSSIGTAMNDGLNIRGSNPDGFQVFLDGMSIFNQNHLFGLLDSFNADAVQTNKYFYDVTPAQFQASTGGTLSLLTRTGSQHGINANAGISNTSLKATMEGPLKKGQSSWLISARNSYMNTLHWFDNPSLIKWGLDIDRPKSILGDGLDDLNAELVVPEDSEAHFFDVHGKVYHEGESGNRIMASIYYGGDRTRQSAFRQARTFSSENVFEAQDVETINNWNNFVGSIHLQQELTDRIYSYSLAGVSAYETDFSKDDFVYTRLTESNDLHDVSMFTFPFINQSTLNEVKAEQYLDISFPSFDATLGATYFFYTGDYLEKSFDRQGFFNRMRSSQVDGFIQLDFRHLDFAHLEMGNRIHYYMNGNYLKWSPRLRLRLFPDSPISLGGGFSRNHQFLHRVSFANAVTSDVWILSDENQPPSSVNHLSAGIYFQPIHHIYLQIETYLKEYQNLRLHEINTRVLSNAFAEMPWFYENSGRGKGVEVLFRKTIIPNIALTQTYTLSSMELRNPYLFDNAPYYADWDRRHSYSSTLEVE
ncbi:MAG: TonB-dependent receptor, partial [Balneolales bacterium]